SALCMCVEAETAPKGEIVMAQTQTIGGEGAFANRTGGQTNSKLLSPAYQAYQVLHLAFVVAPVIAGLDKFFHLLVNWDMYLAPVIARLSPIGGHGLMLLVGVVEVTAGILVAIKPRIGSYVVSA